jgi:hypothetical protein
MAKQATYRVSAIKLPDGRYTWTGRNTLKELFRVHFPDSRITDDSGDVQGQLNLDAHRCKMNMGDWNLSRTVFNHFKIKWAVGTFIPLKSVRLQMCFCNRE